MNIQSLITQLNKTDQLYQHQNTPELALERANIRKQLFQLSERVPEKTLFINQAVLILEQALMTFDELTIQQHIQLSLMLSECYLDWYELNKQVAYLTIAEQIIKPLSHHNYRSIYLLLSKINALQNKPKLSQHWQNKSKHGKEFSIFDNFLTTTLQ